jgi:hypothetical protein
MFGLNTEQQPVLTNCTPLLHLPLASCVCLCHAQRGTPLSRDTALAAAAAYQHLYCEGMEEEDATDNIAATYQVCDLCVCVCVCVTCC